MVSLIWTVVVVLFVLWLLGFSLHVAGGLIHLLLRIAFVILALLPPGVGIGVILYLVLWFLMEPPEGAPSSATRNVGARLRAMGDDLREDFRTGFRTRESATATPTPADSPSGPGPPIPPARGGWGGPALRDRPRGLWAGILLIALGA